MNVAPPSERPATSRPARRRSALAVLMAAVLAVAGIAAAAPASAEEVPVDSSSIEITVTDCDSYDGLGSVRYVVRDSVPSYPDFVQILDASGNVVHEETYSDGTEFEAEVALEPGDYLVRYTAGGETNPRYRDEQSATVGACPDLGLSVTATCSAGDDGAATADFTGLVVGMEYGYFLQGLSASASGTFTADAASEQVVLSGLPPGNYYLYVETTDDSIQYDWREFAVEPCQPEMVLELAQCTALGGDAGVDVTASNLVEGVAYTITGPDGSTKQVTGDSSGTATASFASLEPGTSGTVSITGTWTVEAPYEEPPFIGGGNFTPLDTVVPTAGTEASFEPCAAVLPSTGVDQTAPLALAGLLLAFGGALLVAIRRRTVTRD